MANAIEIEKLFVAFKKGSVQALQGIDLNVRQGAVFGFIGPNGAGKTTTMHVLLGFLKPTSGSARIFGEDIRNSLARQRIGYLPEQPQLYPFLTGRELLVMTGELFNLRRAEIRQRTDTLLTQLELSEAADRKIATYSRGMMQRIGLAQALINDPDLVILDEPTGGLDPLGRLIVRRVIADLKQRGKTVFFSSHELSEVEYVCDYLALLARGRIVAEGKAGDLVKEGERLEQYFLRMIGDETA